MALQMDLPNEIPFDISGNLPPLPTFELPNLPEEIVLEYVPDDPVIFRNFAEEIAADIDNHARFGPMSQEMNRNPDQYDIGDYMNNVSTSLGKMSLESGATDVVEILHKNLPSAEKEDHGNKNNSSMSQPMILDEICQPAPSARVDIRPAMSTSRKRTSGDSGFESENPTPVEWNVQEKRPRKMRLYEFILYCLFLPEQYQNYIIWKADEDFAITINKEPFYIEWMARNGKDGTDKAREIDRSIRQVYYEDAWNGKRGWPFVLELAAGGIHSYHFHPAVVASYLGCTEEEALAQIKQVQARYNEECKEIFAEIYIKKHSTKEQMKEKDAQIAARKEAKKNK